MTLDDLRRRLVSDRQLTLVVRCHPGAKAAKINDELMADDSLKISVRAKAEDGRANDELLALLAEAFAGAEAVLLSGQTSRRKTVRLTLA